MSLLLVVRYPEEGAGLLNWAPLSGDDEDQGLLVKELRNDPGSGARTWLLSVSPG